MINISVFNFTWNQEMSNDLNISELTVRPNGGCKTDRYVLSNELLPHNISYLEVVIFWLGDKIAHEWLLRQFGSVQQKTNAHP